jgi:glycoprotein endo-alpha-1,2-mannosidase
MRVFNLGLACILLLSAGCSTPTPEITVDQPPSPQPDVTDATETETEEAWPPVVGPDPSPRIAAFYYPWYYNPEFDGHWDHWGNNPPGDISSDYYPLLGPYSISDPNVLAQHFAWLREAGVGLIISSWWGIGNPTDTALPQMLDIADHYGIQIGFHIEPYAGRTAENLIRDIHYLYDHYGHHPAFFWTTETSCYSPESQPKGLFFIWSTVAPDTDSPHVSTDYWMEALDVLHSEDPGAIVITDMNDTAWVTDSHFDGSYNYGVLDVDEGGYTWAYNLPSCAWYIPGINPGFSAIRINYEDWVNTPRQDGATYDDRWEQMFAIGIEPPLIAITTFNEWHEGTMIEPAVPGMTRPNGEAYLSFEPLAPDAYLEMTREWAQVFLDYEWPEISQVSLRLQVRTTSDWTTLELVSGATWLRPMVVSASEEVTNAEMVDNLLAVNQPLNLAEAGNQVEVVFEIQIQGGEVDTPLVFEIERGGLGATWVELFRLDGEDWVLVDSFTWAGHGTGARNIATFEVDYETAFGTLP